MKPPWVVNWTKLRTKCTCVYYDEWRIESNNHIPYLDRRVFDGNILLYYKNLFKRDEINFEHITPTFRRTTSRGLWVNTNHNNELYLNNTSRLDDWTPWKFSSVEGDKKMFKKSINDVPNILTLKLYFIGKSIVVLILYCFK